MANEKKCSVETHSGANLHISDKHTDGSPVICSSFRGLRAVYFKGKDWWKKIDGWIPIEYIPLGDTRYVFRWGGGQGPLCRVLRLKREGGWEFNASSSRIPTFLVWDLMTPPPPPRCWKCENSGKFCNNQGTPTTLFRAIGAPPLKIQNIDKFA